MPPFVSQVQRLCLGAVTCGISQVSMALLGKTATYSLHVLVLIPTILIFHGDGSSCVGCLGQVGCLEISKPSLDNSKLPLQLRDSRILALLLVLHLTELFDCVDVLQDMRLVSVATVVEVDDLSLHCDYLLLKLLLVL